MRWALGTLLIIFIVGVPLDSRSGDQEMNERHGLLAKAFLKGCDELTTTPVDFDGSGDFYHVEWWRCGSKNPNPKTGNFPVHYVLIRPPKGASPMLGVTVSNAGSSDEYFIDQLQLVRLPANSRQLLLVSGRYYDGAEQKRTIDCLVERIADQLECSPSSPESGYSAQQSLRVHEKGFFRKLDEYLTQ